MATKLEEVLQAVQDVKLKVNDKLSAMKQEMESADDQLVKKMRLDTKLTFKKRGHEKQYQVQRASAGQTGCCSCCTGEDSPCCGECSYFSQGR